LIFCSRCKGRFYGHKRENLKDNAYICTSQRYGEFCGNRGIGIDYLDELVLKNVLTLEKQIKVFFDDMRADRFTLTRVKEIEKLTQEIKDLKTASSNLLDVVEKSGMDPLQFKSRFENIQKQKVSKEEKLELIKKNLGILSNEKDITSFIKSSINEYKTYTSKTDKIMFLRNFVEKIYIQYDEDTNSHYVAIHYKLIHLGQYHLAKEILVNRTKTDKNRKRIENILQEDVLIVNNTIDIDNDKKITRIRFVK
jgi:hypothetical protein